MSIYYDQPRLQNPMYHYPTNLDSNRYISIESSLPQSIPSYEWDNRGEIIQQEGVPAKTSKTDGDGKFSLFTAAKEFLKGAIVRPIQTIIEHPILTLGAIGASAVAISAAPVLLPILVTGGLLYGGYKGAQGMGDAIHHFKNGDYDEAERSFGDIGEGVFAAATSATGIRAASSITAEAKVASTLGSATNAAERTAIMEKGINAAVKARSGNLSKSGREILTLFASKSGRNALKQQLSADTFFPAIKSKITGFGNRFKTPPKTNVNQTVSTVQKRLNIADKDMPKVVTNMDDLGLLGKISTAAYKPQTHTVHVISDPFKMAKHQMQTKLMLFELLGKGYGQRALALMDKLPQPLKNFMANQAMSKTPLENIIAHEMTHAKQFHAMQNLSKSQAKNILKDLPIIDVTLPNGKIVSQNLGKVIKGETTSSLLNGKRFASESSKATGESYLQAKKALTDVYKTLISNQQAIFNGRPYLANPSEIEARLMGSQFAGRKSLRQFSKDLEVSPEALKTVRDIKIEQKLNQLITQIEGLKQGPPSSAANIQTLESELKALTKLFGHQSATQKNLKGYYLQERGVQLAEKTNKASEQLKQIKKSGEKQFSQYQTATKESAQKVYGTGKAKANQFYDTGKVKSYQFYDIGKAHAERLQKAAEAGRQGFVSTWKQV